LKIDGSEGYLNFIDLPTCELLLAESEKAVEFMMPTPGVPTVGAN
jgi:hypothetical protein